MHKFQALGLGLRLGLGLVGLGLGLAFTFYALYPQPYSSVFSMGMSNLCQDAETDAVTLLVGMINYRVVQQMQETCEGILPYNNPSHLGK